MYDKFQGNLYDSARSVSLLLREVTSLTLILKASNFTLCAVPNIFGYSSFGHVVYLINFTEYCQTAAACLSTAC